MKPGKPMTFATISKQVGPTSTDRQLLVFGLPGNPASCVVTFNLFVVPAIRALSGWLNPTLPR
jgi:gephyrin